MRKIVLLAVTISTLFLSGCFSYKDMNRVYFSTMSIHDIKGDDTVVLYEEHFASDRGNTEQGGTVSRVVLRAEGKTHHEAFSNIQVTATYPINYDVKRALGFTIDMAKKSIEPILGPLERDQKVTNKVFLFICDCEPEDFFNIQMEDEKFLGIWLEDLFIFQKDEARVISVRANQYLNERLKGSRVSVLPIIGIEKYPTESRLKISGAAIMKDSKMVGRLEIDEIPVYKILFNKTSRLIGGFNAYYPINKGVTISFVPLNLKTKERIDIVNDELTLIYDIKMICSIQSVEGVLDLLDKRIREGVIKAAEDTIKKRGEDFYKKYQREGIDILDVELKLKRKFRDVDMRTIDEDTFRSVKIQINPTVTLEGSQKTSDTIE